MLRITAFLIALVACEGTSAASNLVMSCPRAVAGSRLPLCLTLEWVEPKPDTLVASCSFTCLWNSPDSAWRPYSTAIKVLRCTQDILPATFKAGVGPDPCPESAKSWAGSGELIVRTAKWSAPTSNDDNSPLTDLAGYHVSVALTDAGPWRLVASPTATSIQMQVSPLERCVRVVARTRTGVEGAPATVCVNKPVAVGTLTFE